MMIPAYVDVVAAHALVSQFAHRTPILSSASINQITGGDL